MPQIITKDIFSIVTNLIIERLEQGIIPWKQPWRDIGPPRNFVTQRPYRGINFLLLNISGYPQNEYLTFKQVQDLGGRVKKGEKAHLVVLWLWVDEGDENNTDGVCARKRPLLRYYFVFNVSQCVGLPSNSGANAEQLDPIEKCEGIVAAMPSCPEIVHRENEAYYHSVLDLINMPNMQAFETSQEYYATLFHELVHSTGHKNRLNRKELVEQTKFGSDTYSIEELTAEIGACYLNSYAGIETDRLQNSVAYIKGWLNQLQQDKKFIVYASAHAQKAVDYILGISPPETIENAPKQSEHD